jgi:hypothetical protein
MIHKPSIKSLLRAAGNLLQIIAIAALMLVLVYATIVSAINLFLGSGRGQVMMNNALRGYALREFSARRIHLDLWGTLTVDDFALSRTFGFVSGTALRAGKVSVHVKPSAFFGKQARVSSILVEGLQVSAPYPSLTDMLACPMPYSHLAGPAILFLADTVHIVGALNIMDAIGKRELASLKNLDFTATNVSAEKPFDVKVEADIEAHGKWVRMQASAMADAVHQRLSVQRGSIDKMLSFMGNVDMSGKIPHYDLTVEGERATWEKLMEMATGNNTVRTSLRSNICLLITGNPDCLTVENKPQK